MTVESKLNINTYKPFFYEVDTNENYIKIGNNSFSIKLIAVDMSDITKLY